MFPAVIGKKLSAHIWKKSAVCQIFFSPQEPDLAVTKGSQIIKSKLHSVFEIQRDGGNISVLHKHIEKNNAVSQSAELCNFTVAEFPYAD